MQKKKYQIVCEPGEIILTISAAYIGQQAHQLLIDDRVCEDQQKSELHQIKSRFARFGSFFVLWLAIRVIYHIFVKFSEFFKFFICSRLHDSYVL